MKDYKVVIKEKRTEMNLSQNQLAKMVGISQPFINEIESGRKTPSLEVFFKICEALEIKLFEN